MSKYEYIRLEIDLGDLDDLNALSGQGWHVVAYFHEDGPATVLIAEPHRAHYVLLERELPEVKHRPTIEELEAILKSEGDRKIEILPDGSIRAI